MKTFFWSLCGMNVYPLFTLYTRPCTQKMLRCNLRCTVHLARKKNKNQCPGLYRVCLKWEIPCSAWTIIEKYLSQFFMENVLKRPRAINLISWYQEIKVVGNYQTHPLPVPPPLISWNISAGNVHRFLGIKWPSSGWKKPFCFFLFPGLQKI